MKRTRAEIKAELMNKAEQEIDRLLDWEEKADKPTLTQFENQVMVTCKALSEAMLQGVMAGQETHQPAERVKRGVTRRRQHLHLFPRRPHLDLESHLPPPIHSPENNHVASVPSHPNTRPAQPKAAIRIPSSAGPTHPMVSVPSSMIASRLLALPNREGAVGEH